MKLRQSLFWDVDPTTIDLEKNARYVIERVLDFGTGAEVRWLFKQYSLKKITEDFEKSRVIGPKSRAFWEIMLAYLAKDKSGSGAVQQPT